MRTINLFLFIVTVISVSYGQPLKPTDENPDGFPATSASPRMEAQTKRIQELDDLPINRDIHEKVIANLGNNTIATESSFVTLLREIFPVYAFKEDSSEETLSIATNSNLNETTFFEVLKKIFPPNSFTENSTDISLESGDYDDEDEEPEGLGPRLSATLLKILTF